MAATPSTMAPLGTVAPDFTLPEPLTGEQVSLANFADKRALCVAFISNHCPFVIHIAEALARYGADYAPKGVALVAIGSNDAKNYPQDGPEAIALECQKRGYGFPYLYDESQSVAKAYRAACTPDFYLFDADRRLVYRGEFDRSRPGNDQPVDGCALREATDRLLSGQPPLERQRPSIGCNIKWRAGNAPAYFG